MGSAPNSGPRSSSTPPPPSLSLNDLKPFIFGGVAACVAEASTFPIDTAKTRLQLQGQKAAAHSNQMPTTYKGMVNCWYRVCSEEGFRSLYRGLGPALLRQASYGTIKFGLYYTIKSHLPGEESNVKNILSAVFAGSISAALANPTDVLKVRLQSVSNASLVSGKGVFQCFGDIYQKEGLAGLWRGVFPTAQRAAVVAGVQLPVYDFTKSFILCQGWLRDGAGNHLISSFCAGICACLASTPLDVVRTRLMNQRKMKIRPVPVHIHSDLLYRSSLQCAYLTVKNEGPMALYKGFIPSFTRMGPWNIIFFLVYERLKTCFSS